MDKAASKASSGFTFTISSLIIALTLISLAQFSSDWSRSRQASIEISLQDEPLSVQNAIASDFASMLGAKGGIRRTGAGSAVSSASATFPFEQEGLPFGSAKDYSLFLAAAASKSGLEISIYPNISSAGGTALFYPKNGSFDIASQGQFDKATYIHPAGWAPSEINITLRSLKAAQSVGEFVVQNEESMQEPETITYNLLYFEPGKSFSRTAIAQRSHNLSLQILYPDQTQILIHSGFSMSLQKNYTSISYTKSPGAYLVFPFESPNPLADYYNHGFFFELGGGMPESSPQHVEDCISGSCYEFDGVDDYLNISLLDFTQSPPSFRKGKDRMQDGDFEYFYGEPDDLSQDYWPSWDVEQGGASYFDATRDAKVGAFALRISPDQSSSGRIVQRVDNLLENTEYTLSFWARGSSQVQYAISNERDEWLQPDGSWGGGHHLLSASAPGDAYKKIETKFALPRGQSMARIYLYASPDYEVYFDGVQLRRTEGLNGGFEHYYSDWGPQGGGLVPEGN
ncbi:MAG: carbohydrate binding domain-containing protein [Candidatus Micrarchaeota archaeon]|nr:carbohydrate binding domain-containing protein [Candidatus Micrarchaeota archaeon]